MVVLLAKGKANGKGKGKGGGQWMFMPAAAALTNGGSRDGYNPTEAAAIREIKEQLREQGNEGNVWIQGWGTRFQGELGSIRDFLESRPDKFTIIEGQGRRFSVAITANGSVGTTFGAGRVNMNKAVHGGSEADAIREIVASLKEQGGSGNIWVPQWGRRYEPNLGNVRDFLESHPDKFAVVPGEGRKFSVQLLKGGKRQGPANGSVNANNAAHGGSEADAIREIVASLKAQGGSGNVWVQQWGRRYEKNLGPVKDFMESHPEKFNVIPGEGRKFSVELVQGSGGKRARPAGGSVLPLMPVVKKSKGVGGEGFNPLVGEAIRTINEQLRAGSNKVWVPGWGNRFQGELGSLKDFLESRPDKFTVIPGDGNKFTVEKA